MPGNLDRIGIAGRVAPQGLFTGPLCLCMTERGQHQWQSEGNGPKLQYVLHREFSFSLLNCVLKG